MREYENIHSESYKTAKYTNIDKGFAGDIDKQFLDLSNKFPIDTKDIDVKALSKDGIFGCYSGGLSYVDKKTGTIGVTQQITLSNKNMPNKEIAERKHITEATRRGSKNISGLSTVDHEYAHAIDLQYAYKTDKTLHDRMLKYNNFKLTGTSQERNSVIRDINDINAQLHSSSRALSEKVKTKLMTDYKLDERGFWSRVNNEYGSYATTNFESVMWETLKDLEPSFAEAVKQGYLGTAKYPPGASKEMIQALDSLSKQAINDFNLVNSNMLNSSLDAYRKIVANTVTMANFAEAQAILNSAAGGVVMGVASRQKALADAIKKMADNGITGFYDKAGKEWSPEAYINMSLRTTMSNTANKTVFNRCDEYGNDLVEISSHSGARPKCAADQGKLYSRAGKSGTAEDLNGNKIQYSSFSSTSYGQPDGILGINCGHRPSAFTPGFSRMSPPINETKEENDIAYKQSTEQRKIERQAREAKREAQAHKLAGNQEAFDKAAARVKLKQDQYKAFCNDTGRTPRPDRLQVTGYDKKTAQDVKNANAELIKRKDYLEKTKPTLDKIYKDTNKYLQNTFTGGIMNNNYTLPQKSLIENVRTIAGHNSSTPIRCANELVKQYGGKDYLWKKQTGTVAGKHFSYEIHWYEYGNNQYEVKLKTAPKSVKEVDK